MPKQSETFFSSTTRTGDVHSVWTGFISSIVIVLSISCFLKSFSFGPAWYCSEFIGRLSVLLRVNQCCTVLIDARKPFHVMSNCMSRFWNCCDIWNNRLESSALLPIQDIFKFSSKFFTTLHRSACLTWHFCVLWWAELIKSLSRVCQSASSSFVSLTRTLTVQHCPYVGCQ